MSDNLPTATLGRIDKTENGKMVHKDLSCKRCRSKIVVLIHGWGGSHKLRIECDICGTWIAWLPEHLGQDVPRTWRGLTIESIVYAPGA